MASKAQKRPVLHYESTAAAILDLHMNGQPVASIAKICSVSSRYVSSVLSRMRKIGRCLHTVNLNPIESEYLLRHARIRGMPTNILISKVLEAIIEDDILPGIMDDGIKLQIPWSKKNGS